MKTLVLGGARSGKSKWAEKIAGASGKAVIYLATAQARDEEMQQRIAHHQTRRPAHWVTIEEPLDIAEVIRTTPAGACLLIDCLTLWLSNALHQCQELHGDTEVKAQAWQALKNNLLLAIRNCQCDLIIVSNETGLGVVPLGELTRQFVDEAGWLHQALGELTDNVGFCVAGFMQILKGKNPI
ncbi:MAG TPA: bifunctional adenosylcobinamide kinase/adenosylcobinamide-phosphate guanylyltransferase [Pseudomonadales bacterium]|nr:bifunctional adenosylcobinamide kinase/adenosylcobinamide-phosphate guanylyltransferase [Pseudomonadales bacterium]